MTHLYHHLLLVAAFAASADGTWLISHLASSQVPPRQVDCTRFGTLSRQQRQICAENAYGVRAAVAGIKEAVDECRKQFSKEKWNCSADNGFSAAAFKGKHEQALYFAYSYT
ncbi:protein Wnt-16-like protein [Aphelenchoides avenae]|nr:protein Wnt-16-like protein [Aphelenchus avenae]